MRAWLVVLGMLLAGCTSAPEGPAGDNAPDGDFSQNSTAPPAEKWQCPGSFVLTENGRPASLNWLGTEVFEGPLTALGNTLCLPQNVPFLLQSCGTENAFWDPSTSSITFCWELLSAMQSRFAQLGIVGTELANSVRGSAAFVTLHEVGHGLQDLLDLPLTGPEEDTVDQFATVMMASGDASSQAATFYAVRFWLTGSGSPPPAWDEHSPDERRAMTILCLVYGSNPSGFSAVKEYLGNRAPRCPGEWSDQVDAWTRVLEGHFKPGRGLTGVAGSVTLQERQYLRDGVTFEVAAASCAGAPFDITKASEEIVYQVFRSDQSRMDSALVTAQEFQNCQDGRAWRGYALVQDVGTTAQFAVLPAGSYAFVINCRNSFFDCDGSFNLWRYS